MLRLDNPAQQRSVNQILSSLPEADRPKAIHSLRSVQRAFEQQRKQDADLVDSLIRILKSPLGRALRKKLKEIAHEH